MDYIWPLLDLTQSRAPFIRDSIRTDMWGPLVIGASGPKFSMGGKYAAEAENISSKWPFYPQQKGTPLPHLSRVFVTIFPHALYQLPSAPDLVHRRPVPAHWICFPVGHYLRTGAAPSIGQHLRRAATPTIDHGQSRYAKSILFAQSFPSSSSSMEPIVDLYSPSCQQPVTSQPEVLLSHNKSVPATRHNLPNKIRTHTHTHTERGGVRKSNIFILYWYLLLWITVWSGLIVFQHSGLLFNKIVVALLWT